MDYMDIIGGGIIKRSLLCRVWGSFWAGQDTSNTQNMVLLVQVNKDVKNFV